MIANNSEVYERGNKPFIMHELMIQMVQMRYDTWTDNTWTLDSDSDDPDGLLQRNVS